MEPGARAGGYYGEPGWLDKAVLGMASLLGMIVSGELTTEIAESLLESVATYTGDDLSDETRRQAFRIRGLVKGAPPPLLKGDSAIGHLNNALQIIELAPPGIALRMNEAIKRVELAVRLLNGETD